MNQREFAALGAAELDPMAVVLYVRAFRRYMNFATGESALSLSRLVQEMEYHPPACSRRGKVESMSTKRVRTLIGNLVDAGLLVQIRPGNAAKKLPAVYHCVLATTDSQRSKSPSLTKLRPNEDGHIADTVHGHIDGHSKNRTNKDPQANQGHIDGHSQNFDDGHISEISEIKPSLSNARARETSQKSNFSTGQELSFSDQFKQTAKITGLTLNEDQLSGLFDTFRFHRKHRNTMRSPADWLAEWRVWCGREKSYGRPNTQKHSRPGGNQRAENPTARLLRESKEAAAELARTGYYDQGEQSDDDSEF